MNAAARKRYGAGEGCLPEIPERDARRGLVEAIRLSLKNRREARDREDRNFWQSEIRAAKKNMPELLAEALEKREGAHDGH